MPVPKQVIENGATSQFTLTPLLTESIQDTSPRIHPWRNKKRVSEKLAPRIYNLSVGSMLQSKI